METRATLLMLTILTAGCVHIEPALQGNRMKDVLTNPSDRNFYRVRGIGAAPRQGSTDTTIRRAASRDAALVAARKELLALIGGVRLTGGIVVRDALLVDSHLREDIDRLVFGAEEALTEFDLSDNCVVTLQVKREAVDEIIKGIKPQDLPPPLPQPQRTFWKEQKKEEDLARMSGDAVDGYSPRKALVFGLIFPGGGQFYASGKLDRDVNGNSPVMFKGCAFMTVTMTLVAVGASYLEKAQGPYANDNPTKRTVGMTCIGLGAVTWIYAALSAKDALEQPLLAYAGPGGYGLRYAWRFGGMRRGVTSGRG